MVPIFFKRLTLELLTFAGYIFIRFLGLSIRFNFVYKGEQIKDQSVIYCFWHDRLLMMPFFALGQKVTILISQHRDGEYISRIVSLFGFRSIRGSSTRGGTIAIRKLAREIVLGCNGAITPDGPRGPRHRVKEGAIFLASLTGAPLIPLAFSSSKKKVCQPGIIS